MFESKITVSVMRAGVVCGCIFLCVSNYLQGSEAWVGWAYPTVIGVAGLVLILVIKDAK